MKITVTITGIDKVNRHLKNAQKELQKANLALKNLEFRIT